MFPGCQIKVDGKYDFIIFSGGAMKAEPAPSHPGCWLLSFIWDRKYGEANQFTKRWVERQMQEGVSVFSTERVNDIWNTLVGKGEVKKERD